MDVPRQLSRFDITGDVDNNTPVCVLIEMCDAHGINYDLGVSKRPNFAQGLIDSLYETNIHTVHDIKSNESLRFVASFVNNKLNWPRSKLIEAYNFLIQFCNNEEPLHKIPLNFHYGLQTPEHPTSVNACVLYKICVAHRLHVTCRTTIEQLAYAVQMLREDSAALLRRVTSFIRGEARRTDLINTLMLSPYQIRDPAPREIESVDISVMPPVNVQHDMLVQISASLNDVKILQQKITPTTNNGAVGLAAINYGMDLSMVQDPVTEYYNLNSGGRAAYIPADPWIKHWIRANPNMFDLTITFNPVFPESYYSARRLSAMVQYEGFSQVEIASATSYQLMQLAYVSETFYVGPLPNMSDIDTPISYVPIQEIPPGELLCYGSRESSLRPVSVEELIELFQANNNFTDPFNSGAIFSSNAITKLKNIMSESSGLSPNTMRLRMDLVNLINHIQHVNSTTDGATRDLMQVYHSVNYDTKEAILNAFTKLLHAGFYMRGWMGPGHPYPIEKALVPASMDGVVNINSTNSIVAYETALRNLGAIGRQINNLPLVRFRGGQYQKSTDREKGLTIGERIHIIKQGDTTSNIQSCIRLSSNWLCASAHNYLVVLGQPAPFDIFYLRDIA